MKKSNPKNKGPNKNNKNMYSVRFGDLTIKAEAFQSFTSLRRSVLNDSILLFGELEKIKALAECYADDDDEDEDDFPEDKKKKLKLKARIKKRIKKREIDSMYQ